MNNEEHDALWDLLGKSRQPKASPFFAQKVLRAIETEPAPRAGFLAWLKARWYLPVTAGACAAVMALLVLRSHDEPAAPSAGSDALLAGIASAAADAPETIPSLDALLASEEHSIWLAGDPSSLY